MKIAWVHDYSPEDYQGGAELSDYYWIKKGRELGHEIIEVKRRDEIPDADYYILSNFWATNFTKIQGLLSKPYTILVHGQPIRRDYKPLYQNARKIVFMSPSHLKVNKYLPNEKKDYCAPYIDHNLFPELIDWNDRTNQNLYLGNVDFDKGIKLTIKNIEERIDFVGQGRLETIQYIKQTGNIYKIKVPNNKVAEVMNQYRYFCWYLARYGSYGRTLIEAILCGCRLKCNKSRFGLFSYKWDFEDRNNIINNLENELDKFWNIAIDA